MISNISVKKTDAMFTLAIFWLENLSKLQFFVTIMMHVLMILAIHPLDVFSLQKFVKEKTNVSHLLVINLLENVLLDQFYVTMETNVQLTLVKQQLDNANILLLVVTITTHVPLILVMLLLGFVSTSTKFVMTRTFVLLTVVAHQLENVSSLMFLQNWLLQNHQINVSPILVMQFLELLKNQSLVLMDQLVQQRDVIHQEGVSMIQFIVNVLLVLNTNVTLNPTNVKSSFQIVMIMMHVLLILSNHALDVFILQNVLLLMHVLSLLAVTDNALILQRIVMMEMHVLSTLVTCALELVFTLQSLVLVELTKLELAIQQLQNVFSEKHVKMILNVLEMEIQLIFHTAALLDVIINKASK
jgi:hypothetical protein